MYELPSLRFRSKISISHILMVISMAFIGTFSLILLFSVRPIISGTLFAGMLILIAAVLSGNPRLFFLIGLVMTLPLDLSKFYSAYPHFGGEWAIRIEAVDPFLAVLCFFWIKDMLFKRSLDLRIPLAAILWIVLMLISMAAMTVTVYRTMAGYEIIRMTKVLLLFLFLVNNLHRERQFQIVVYALIVGALLQCLYGIFQHVTGISFGLVRMGEATQVVAEEIGRRTSSRVGAMLGHPNMFASYLVMILPIAFALLFSRLYSLLRYLNLTVFLLGCAALILTLSRGGWISFTFAVGAVYILTLLHPRLHTEALGMRLFMLLAFTVIGMVSFSIIYQKFTLSDPSSVSSRIELLRIAARMIREHPWFGLGLNAFTFYVEQYDMSRIEWSDMQPPVHNIYLLVWAEQGTIGFIIFCTLLISVIIAGLKNLRCDNRLLLVINIGALAGFCAALTHALVDWTLRANTVHRIFWVLAAIIFSIRYWRMQQHEQGDVTETKS